MIIEILLICSGYWCEALVITIVTVPRSPESGVRCESYGLKTKRSRLTGLFSIAGLDLKPELNSFCFNCRYGSLVGLQLKLGCL